MKKIFLVLIMLSSVSIIAQDGPPGPPTDNTIDVAPIDDHLWVILLLGLGLGIYFILSKKSTSGK